MTRRVAGSFNHIMGETFVEPQDKLREDTMLVPGTDGEKMSKSRNNIINVFLPQKQLKKQVMGIQTDSTPLEDPKDPETCNAFALYKLVAGEEKVNAMAENYRAGGYGYGHAKLELLNTMLDQYKEQRERYNEFMDNKALLDEILEEGAAKARNVARGVLNRVREKVGFVQQ
jgi:tryptophanyl-tRNA synthetase